MPRPRSRETIPETFRRMADDFERGGSPLYARLARAHADDPVLEGLGAEHEPRWEIPLRVFGAVHFLALSGRANDPWSRFGEVLREHRAELARFVAEQPVQTNEVQRSWALLPAFLAVADGRPLDLVELGPSAGLNLFWDRYRYRYGEATWGREDAPLVLAGEAVAGPPPRLLAREAEVRGRAGIDRSPLDVTRERDALVLQAFVWADQRARLDRLRRALEVARGEPPRLVRGDYVDLLPGLLADRRADGVTVVFHSASTAYLRREDRARLAGAVADAGEEGPLAWISYEFVEEEEELDVGFESFALDVRRWPGGEARRLARLDGHANRMQWLDRPL